MEQFYSKLNSSYDVDMLYKRYENYRQEVSHIIKKQLKPRDSVLIVGPGNLNDLDLETFTDQPVHMLDIDLRSVEEGIRRQNHLISDYRLIQGDITGLSKSGFYNNFNLLQLDYDKIEFDFELNQYDLIIILPIYTQILLPQLMMEVSYESLNAYLPLIQERINNFNSLLYRHLNEEGRLVIFSDVLEYKTDQEEAKYLIAHKNHKIILDDFFNSYLNTFGHGLGSYGILDASTKVRQNELGYLVWPFSDDRTMLVQWLSGKK